MAKKSLNNSAEYQRRICRAIDFINVHLAESPSVAEIARAAPFSSFHFQRLFRAIIGETVAEFTRRLRLETAARHLRYRRKGDITELAFELGFSSSQNFAKAFKKHFGVSASQYRDKVRDDAEGTSAFGHGREQTGLQPSTIQVKSIASSVEVRSVTGYRVVYRRHFGTYNDPGVQAAFDALVRWAKPRGFDLLERYLGIPWDDADVTIKNKCRFDACVIVPNDIRLEGGVNTQNIPKGRYAVYRCEIVANDFDLPWTRLMRDWLPGSGFQPGDGPRFEAYLRDGSRDPEGSWQMEAFLPVKPL